jgi:hypothetical protein
VKQLRRFFEQDKIMSHARIRISSLYHRRFEWQNTSRADIEMPAQFSHHLRLERMAGRIESWK